MEFYGLSKFEWRALKKKKKAPIKAGRSDQKERKKKEKTHIKRIYERQVFINTSSTLGPLSKLENKVRYDRTPK